MQLVRGSLSRRGFMDRSLAALTIGAGLPLWYAREVLASEEESALAPAEPERGPNDQIVMGAIGVGGQGTGDMKWAKSKPGVKFVAVCDVDAERRKKAADDHRQRLSSICRFSRDACQGEARCRDDRHGRSLARPDRDRGDEARLRRLLREATVA